MTEQMIQKALLGAMHDIAKIGIAKLGKADAGGARYNFRGIDQAMNEMSPILVNNRITVTPRYSELNVAERSKGDGKFMRFVTIKGSFTFAADDGSSVVAEAYGEAMDSGDKATIKAQSVAFRTVLFQQFIVPLMAMDTELDHDEDDEPTDGMSPGQLSDFLAAIDAAATVGELKTTYMQGLAAANALNDTKAVKRLTAARDAKVAKAKA
jgi:hypothetical protein